jgi:hypothetical protein
MERALDCFASEHTVASTASPLTPLDHFTLNLDCFAQSMMPPPASKHAIDLDHFTDAPDHVLCSTLSFPSP